MDKEDLFIKEVIYIILIAEQNKKAIKKEEISKIINKSLIGKKYEECFAKIQTVLENVFRMKLVDVSYEGKSIKYILINLLPLEKKIHITISFVDEIHWIAISAVCLIALSGGEIDKELFISCLKKITKKENLDETIKTLEDRMYISQENKIESSDTQTVFVAAPRTLFEFTTKGLFSYIKEIGLDYFDNEKLLLVNGSIENGFEKMCDNIKNKTNKKIYL